MLRDVLAKIANRFNGNLTLILQKKHLFSRVNKGGLNVDESRLIQDISSVLATRSFQVEVASNDLEDNILWNVPMAFSFPRDKICILFSSFLV